MSTLYGVCDLHHFLVPCLVYCVAAMGSSVMCGGNYELQLDSVLASVLLSCLFVSVFVWCSPRGGACVCCTPAAALLDDCCIDVLQGQHGLQHRADQAVNAASCLCMVLC